MGRNTREWERGVCREGRCRRSAKEGEGGVGRGLSGGGSYDRRAVRWGGARERGRSMAASHLHWPALPALRRHH